MKAEERSTRAEERLARHERLAVVGRLVEGVSHDFNNVLQGMMGCSDLLLLSEGISDEARRDVELMKELARRGALLTRQLVAFSRRLPGEPEPLDLRGVTTDQEKMLRRLVGVDTRLEIRAEKDVGPVLADRFQIERMLMNLAVTARQVLPVGGDFSIEIKNVDLTEEGRTRPYVMITANYSPLRSGDGDGGDPEGGSIERTTCRWDHLTDRTDEGAGSDTPRMGLSSVRAAAAACSGYARPAEETSQGMTLEILLPRMSIGAKSPPPSRNRPPADTTKTILVAEGEDCVRSLLARTLRSAGYGVMEAGSGADALRLAEEHSGSIDLVLTDVILPDMRGSRLHQRFALRNPETQTLLISGYPNQIAASPGPGITGMAFMEKPFTAERLLTSVDNLLSAVPDEAVATTSSLAGSGGTPTG